MKIEKQITENQTLEALYSEFHNVPFTSFSLGEALDTDPSKLRPYLTDLIRDGFIIPVYKIQFYRKSKRKTPYGHPINVYVLACSLFYPKEGNERNIKEIMIESLELANTIVLERIVHPSIEPLGIVEGIGIQKMAINEFEIKGEHSCWTCLFNSEDYNKQKKDNGLSMHKLIFGETEILG